MSTRKLNKKALVTAAAIPVAVLASGAVVWTSSYSAFSATTANPTNNWSSGTVVLADDDANTAMFTVGNMKPGATGVKCIQVTSSGSLASTVRLYGTSYATTKDLADHVNLKVEEGSGASSSSCADFVAGATDYDGTLAAFGTTKTDFASSVGVWAPAAGEQTRAYRITYTLSANAPDSAQGGTAALGFTWEAQNS